MIEEQVHGDGEDIACIGLWGDGAPYHTRDSLNVLIFNVLSGRHNKRYFICGWSKRMTCQCGCGGRCTFDSVYKVCSWFMAAWKCGVYPAFRDDNVAFEDSNRVGDRQRAEWAKECRRMSSRGCCIQKRADWQFYKQALSLVGWQPEGPLKRCCPCCFANWTTFPFTDPSMSALWRKHRLTHRVFLQMMLLDNKVVSPLFDFCRLEHITVDLMHCGDLGVLPYSYGNVFLEIFKEIGGTTSQPGPALADIMTMVRSGAKALDQDRPPINKLTMTMITAGGGKSPKLKVKAAEARYLLPIVQHILEHYVAMDTPHKVLRYQCIKAIATMYKQMKAEPFKGEDVAEWGRKYLLLYAELGKEALRERAHIEDGWVHWRWYPKHHQFSHFEEQVKVSGSPHLNWNYADESFIGECVNIAEQGHPRTLHRLLADKMRIVA